MICSAQFKSQAKRSRKRILFTKINVNKCVLLWLPRSEIVNLNNKRARYATIRRTWQSARHKAFRGFHEVRGSAAKAKKHRKVLFIFNITFSRPVEPRKGDYHVGLLSEYIQDANGRKYSFQQRFE